MISFDVKSLFTNVPLDETIETILQKVYVEKKIKTSILKPILKELLLLCTKHLHFRFNGETYTQIDGVAMESPLGPLLANIFMISLEEKVLPKVSNYLCYWKRYVDDTYAYVVPEKIDFILKELNSYHPNIKFTYELEENNKITFLDVLINRISFNEIETSVYRKESNTDIYINWYSHAPSQWKIGTLRNLITRAKNISSTEDLLNLEIEHLKTVFCNINDFPKNVVNNIIQQELSKSLKQQDVITDTQENCKNLKLILPYAGKQGTQLTSKMKKQLKKVLPDNVKTMVTYQSKKLASKFPVKDKIDFQHQNNVVYYGKCPNPNCKDDYIGETDRRVIERVIDHNKRDKKSHMLKHSRVKLHTHGWEHDFKLLGNIYQSNIKRKISESLFIRQLKSSPNKQDKSIRFNSYN